MARYARFLLLLLCLILIGECKRHKSRKKRWSTPPTEIHKVGNPLAKKASDGTKTRKVKTSHLLRIDEHDFTMRPAFAGPAVPVGVDVQVESLDSISEVDMVSCLDASHRHCNCNSTVRAEGRDGHVLYSLRVTVTAACNMDFSRFPLDSQTCTLELESYAYTDEDLMLYWKSGDESLSTDDRISLSQFLIQKFHTTSRLAFYSSTGWYNRLYINFTLRRHIFFFLLQTYFPATLMVMLSWVSFWIDRRAVPARVSLGITTVLTMSTIITGVNASMPRVSYIKAVDIYLWVSFVFVFLSVLEYAAVNYLTTVRDGKERKLREKNSEQQSQNLPCTCGMSHTRTMMLDGTYSEADNNSLAGYTRASMMAEDASEKQERMVVHLSLDNESTGTKKKGLRGFRIIQNTHTIDTYSRMIFPGAYILFNLIYWCVYC
ncbi:gamma-aminobutyric acid receptor subunit rho-2 [Cynoglossus semilaevis]|uniref:gamma-aminobutyric acid receptor subunit rho-2 n=1 Tax=Cynoglossus semilaevis TaxID=244447 RepID=UPI000D62B052|nr:gamma-aminobutyric acid receptor subunit rho-2 [Cynoglossus semilaevis]